jgi:hypothetical protein
MATFDGYHIRLTLYEESQMMSVIVSPKRAIQLAHDLICHALRMYP